MDTFQYFGDYYLYFTITAFTAYIYLAGIYYSNRKKVRELDAQEDQIKIESYESSEWDFKVYQAWRRSRQAVHS